LQTDAEVYRFRSKQLHVVTTTASSSVFTGHFAAVYNDATIAASIICSGSKVII
jgi:hypothetical protein